MNDLNTSAAANEAAKPIKPILRLMVLDAIRGFGPLGATSDDVLYAMRDSGHNSNSITTRYKSLATMNRIKYIGTRAGAAGRAQRVMAATEFTSEAANAETPQA